VTRPVSPGTAGAGGASLPAMSSAAVTLTLPQPVLDALRAKVASGDYASEAEVIEQGLRALDQQDAAFDRWLAEDVAASLEAYRRNPGDVVPAEAVLGRIQSRDRAARGD